MGYGCDFSVPGTIYTALMSGEQEWENHINVDKGLKALDMGNQMEAMAAHGNSVIVTSGNSCHFEICNAMYDMRELSIHVGAYNHAHPEDTFAVDELIQSVQSKDKTVYEKYYDWYRYSGKQDKENGIIIYKERIDQIKNQYFKDKSINNLSLEQIQELIKKAEDPSSEINKMVMGY